MLLLPILYLSELFVLVELVAVESLPTASVDAVLPDIPADYAEISGSLLNKTGSTLDDLIELYRKHARYNGFSTRKSTSRLDKTCYPFFLWEKYMECSCAGFADSAISPMITPSPPAPALEGKTQKSTLSVFCILYAVLASNIYCVCIILF